MNWTEIYTESCKRDRISGGYGVEKNLVDQAATGVHGGFSWHDTAEGPEFWKYVHRRLIRLGSLS